MASENETIADIVAVMRHDAELCYDIWLNDPNNNSQSDSICKILNSYADRIEAAWKREREALMPKPEPVGNAAAMREALESVRNWCYNKLNNTSYQVTVEGLLSIVNSALALSTKQR